MTPDLDEIPAPPAPIDLFAVKNARIAALERDNAALKTKIREMIDLLADFGHYEPI